MKPDDKAYCELAGAAGGGKRGCHTCTDIRKHPSTTAKCPCQWHNSHHRYWDKSCSHTSATPTQTSHVPAFIQNLQKVPVKSGAGALPEVEPRWKLTGHTQQPMHRKPALSLFGCCHRSSGPGSCIGTAALLSALALQQDRAAIH